MRVRPLCFLALTLIACDADAPSEPTCDGGPCVDAAVPPIVAECNEGGSRWEPGTSSFREVTNDVQLTGIVGVRLEPIDVDGDGWTDLIVRNYPAAFDDFGANRRTWLLHNERGERFLDVTRDSALLTPRTGVPGGRPVDVIVWGDVDGDGDLDAYLGLGTKDDAIAQGETSEIMIQDAPGHFALGPEDSAVRRARLTDAPGGATFVDYDLDGDLDLFVGHHDGTSISGALETYTDRLYRNDGTGRFEDVTEAAGILTAPWNDLDTIDRGEANARGWSATACDLNDDGLAELLVASYGRAPNHLWQARREGSDVTYVNRSVDSGYAFDENQSWEDNQFARCFCESDRTAEGCADVPAPQVDCSSINWYHPQDRRPFRLGGNSGSTTCGDVDNDGDVDLLTSEIKHWWAGDNADQAELLINEGGADPTFTRPGREATGLVVPHADPDVWDEGIMTNALFDFDLDGWLDVWLGGSDYPGNHGLLYQQTSARQFREVPITEGIDHHRSHGVAVFDFDRDGDLDVVLGHSRARCGAPDDCYETQQIRLFENLVADDGNWVQLRLEGGDGSNRSAIGARVRVTADGVTQTREIDGGHGHFGGQSDLLLTFGLGAACDAEVEITWPDAARTRESFEVVAGHRFFAKRGAPVVVDDASDGSEP